jgi:excisionase family DNA binding protein
VSKLLTPKQVAELLQVAEQSLAKWRMTGVKLPFVKVGSAVRYRLEDVEAFLDKQTVGASK